MTEKLLSPRLRTKISFYKTNELSSVYDYIKKCPEWIRDKLSPLIYQSVNDDLQNLISYIKVLWKSNASLMTAITGRQRIGKTVSQYYLADVLQFKEKNTYVIYSQEDFQKLKKDMPEESFVMFPDLVLLFPSRDWKKDLQGFTNTLSAFRNFYTIAIPDIGEADKSFRTHFTDISEVVQIQDRRILNLRHWGQEFNIVIPKLNKEVIDVIYKKDLEYKKKAFSS